jgi:lipoate-protein ligase A
MRPVNEVAPAWRLIVDPPAGGPWNMAVDEALLDAYAGSEAPGSPTLRLYGWRPACLSLGRTQAARDAHAPGWLRCHGVDLVRRPTGGSAVLHEHERTYAVVGALRSPPFGGGVVETYELVAGAIVRALGRLGFETQLVGRKPGPGVGERQVACFATLSAWEIAWQGRKVVGAAQLRRRGAFLQHGSILLRSDPERLARALGREAPAGAAFDLGRARGRPIGGEELDGALALAFAEAFGTRLAPSRLTDRERERAVSLASWKYASASWTLDGRLGQRERCWGLGREAGP